MNSNTVANALRTTGPVPLSVPATNSIVTCFSPTLIVPSTAAQGVDIGMFFGGAETRNVWYADGLPFLVRAAGTLTPSAFGQNIQVVIFANILSPITGQISAQSSIAAFTCTLPSTQPAAVNWYIDAKCMWDSGSQVLVSSGSFFTRSTTNPVSSLTSQQNAPLLPSLNFSVGIGVTFGAPVSMSATLNDFSADML